MTLSLSGPSVRRWRRSTRFLASAHVAPQSKGWGANTAAYCTGGSLPRCRWMWLVALMCLRARFDTATSICCCSKFASPLSKTARHSSRSPSNSSSLSKGIPHLLKDNLMWSLKRFFWPPPNVGRRRVHYKVGGGEVCFQASLSHGQVTSVVFWVVTSRSRGMSCLLCGESQHEVFCPTSARAG